MLAENFWKIIFVLLVGVGCWFWFQSASKKKKFERQIAGLAELIDPASVDAPRTAGEAERRTFQTVATLHEIVLRGGDDFNPREAADRAANMIADGKTATLLASRLVDNYNTAQELGALTDDGIFSMIDGAHAKITEGIWEGDYLEAAPIIPVDFDPVLAESLLNRTLVPESVRNAMAGADLTKLAYDHANSLHRAGVLDLSAYQAIRKEHDALVKASR